MFQCLWSPRVQGNCCLPCIGDNVWQTVTSPSKSRLLYRLWIVIYITACVVSSAARANDSHARTTRVGQQASAPPILSMDNTGARESCFLFMQLILAVCALSTVKLQCTIVSIIDLVIFAGSCVTHPWSSIYFSDMHQNDCWWPSFFAFLWYWAIYHTVMMAFLWKMEQIAQKTQLASIYISSNIDYLFPLDTWSINSFYSNVHGSSRDDKLLSGHWIFTIPIIWIFRLLE